MPARARPQQAMHAMIKSDLMKLLHTSFIHGLGQSSESDHIIISTSVFMIDTTQVIAQRRLVQCFGIKMVERVEPQPTGMMNTA
jgi:hypothetical protein